MLVKLSIKMCKMCKMWQTTEKRHVGRKAAQLDAIIYATQYKIQYTK